MARAKHGPYKVEGSLYDRVLRTAFAWNSLPRACETAREKSL